MKKRAATIAFFVTTALFVIGLHIIFTATGIGQSAGSRAIRDNGGGMDTAQYQFIMDSTTANFRSGGLAISLVGGFGMLLSGFCLYKEI